MSSDKEGDDPLNQRDSGTTNAKDIATDLINGASKKNHESDLTPISLGRSRNGTNTLPDKSHIHSNNSPSPPASELSEDGLDPNMPTMRSGDNLFTANGHTVETESSPLNFGKLVNIQSNG